MRKLIDLTGQRFGRLVVLDLYETRKSKNGTHAVWRCKCDCGAETVAYSVNLRRGRTTSCGCYSRDVHSQMLRDVWGTLKEAKGNDNVRKSPAEAKI